MRDDIYSLSLQHALSPRTLYEVRIGNFVTVMDPDGVTRKSISLIEAFEGTEFEDMWRSQKKTGDILHTNSIEILDGRDHQINPAFKRGNLLLSIPPPSLVFVVNPETASNRASTGSSVAAWRAGMTPKSTPVTMAVPRPANAEPLLAACDVKR